MCREAFTTNLTLAHKPLFIPVYAIKEQSLRALHTFGMGCYMAIHILLFSLEDVFTLLVLGFLGDFYH